MTFSQIPYLIPYLLAAVCCSHCLHLQQVASDIKGIFNIQASCWSYAVLVVLTLIEIFMI